MITISRCSLISLTIACASPFPLDRFEDFPEYPQGDFDRDGYTEADPESPDCNDLDPTIHSNATEVCDGIDNNCDGEIDNDATDAYEWYLDEDGDGYGLEGSLLIRCEKPEGYTRVQRNENLELLVDCDDSNPNVYPLAVEQCDGIDNNCNILVDEDVQLTFIADVDGDGFGNPLTLLEACEAPEGYIEFNRESTNNAISTLTVDCDDNDPNQYPGAAERCNQEDDDCDGSSDEGSNFDAPIDALTWYFDFDGDGVGTYSLEHRSCFVPAGFVATGGDCLDDDASIYPGAPELCDNLDQDCDGLIDDDPIVGVLFYRDNDGDGDGDSNTTDIVEACYILDSNTQEYLPPTGYSDMNGDCNDQNASISSLLPELCTENIDENCDGSTVIGAVDEQVWYVDADGDGFGNPNFTLVACPVQDLQSTTFVPPTGYSDNNQDCNDLDGTLFPGNTERCNGKLDDCNLAEDQNGDGVVEFTARSVEIDHDQDGFIECEFLETEWSNLATLPLGSGDCQPFDDDVFPGAPELCTGEVEDCLADDYGSIPEDEWDDDGDGYVECEGFIGAGWEGDSAVIGGGDCDDRATDANGDGEPDGYYTYPGAAEFYPDPNSPDFSFCVADANEDGLPDCVRIPTNTNQEAPSGYFCEYGVFLSTTVGPDFVFIPAGIDPKNRYELTYDFYMMTTEVTRDMYIALIGSDPSHFSTIRPGVDYPVENLRWIDAAHFANLLSDRAQLPRCYNENNYYAPFNIYSTTNFYTCPGYRLPTEAEWEYAARSGTSGTNSTMWSPDGGGPFAGSNANLYIDDGVNFPSVSLYAWFGANNIPVGTKQVSRLKANGFGLYDMHGNVREMTNDWSNSTAPLNFSNHNFPTGGTLSNGLIVNPIGTTSGTLKVFRGGSFDTSDLYLLGFEEGLGLYSNPQPLFSEHDQYTGFRLVRTAL